MQLELPMQQVPLMYRVMRIDADLKPRVGPEDLGVIEGYDVHVGEDRIVTNREQGMSVYSHWKKIPTNRKPRRVGGRAENDWHCFKLGEGPFENGAINELLEFLRDADRKKKHGVIRPVRPVVLEEYVVHLAATREQWLEDESNVSAGC